MVVMVGSWVVVVADSESYFESTAHITQTYLTKDTSLAIRVRTTRHHTGAALHYLCVKTPMMKDRLFCSNEFETEVDESFVNDIHAMLENSQLKKARTTLKYGQFVWEIDNFISRRGEDGEEIFFNDFMIAEVELTEEDVIVDIPPFCKTEITGLKGFSNQAIAQFGIPK